MKKQILFIVLFVIIFSGLMAFIGSKQTVQLSSPRSTLTVVLDAGHGGIDVGAVGRSGTLESDLNLVYCKTLKKIMEEYGMNVIMTREDENGLYSEYKNGFKMEDMRKRREIVQNANPDVVISIHMNKFAVSSSRGAQVFYDDENGSGKELAEVMQKVFIENLPYARKEAKSADLYMLKCVSSPSILIECGYLSNAEEEKLLTEEDYINKLCYLIVASVLSVIQK